MQSKLQIGTRLFTKDGRRHGNAIVTKHYYRDVDHYNIETDFGNVARMLTLREVQETWHTTDAEGKPSVVDVIKWRADRQSLLAENKFHRDVL